ncbi:dephospho-CoA kinase [Altibacter sp. HG106]|uniref:dephospho-CoA kinase n=1 Tax=Altibacter sp. HG106 TaxID=3023937 RepID=UPI00235015B1|nr:dephospho-CoA kinase [Altibacter sp. HG106]MDC7995579.1 dephospho-CoA kinase [Altibacter sp. HG106]
MKIIGLTGGIGSGKTTVATMFGALGIPVYVADEAAKRLMNTSDAIRNEICKLLGKEAYEGNTLNRAWIAQQVFQDTALLEQLNQIIHPAVGADFKAWTQSLDAPYCIKEAAILFESGAYKQCDAVVVVTAPKETRLARVLKRDDTDEASIKARMAHQLSDAERVARADFVIENLDLEATKTQVEALHRKLLKMP